MLFIDPDECIDCDACKAECPVEAIFHEDEVPVPWKEFIDLNREMSARCPPITARKVVAASAWLAPEKLVTAVSDSSGSKTLE